MAHMSPMAYYFEFAGRQDERPLAGRHFEEKKQDGRHFSPNMYDTTFHM